ncbi:uncharacterized protein LOC117103515 [Anneissia japonica]|uniref:uncharacterized protein LOC117103515 n=1 Tax=Anneissia japonica TaxID=1529436 RepID=UPI0014259BF3|nr:uncharacterized protein LOC117103515 [Anneissia japonica]
MQSLVLENLNFKKVYERLEKREDLSVKYLDFQLEVVSWDEVPSSKFIPSSVKVHDKFVLAYKQTTLEKSEESVLDDSDSNIDEMCNGNSVLDDSKEELNLHPPVSMGQARSLLSLFCLWKDELTCPTTPMWVMCDGKPPEHVFLMGCSWLKNEARKNIINTYTISCQGPYHSKIAIPSVQQLREEFSQSGIFNAELWHDSKFNLLQIRIFLS